MCLESEKTTHVWVRREATTGCGVAVSREREVRVVKGTHRRERRRPHDHEPHEPLRGDSTVVCGRTSSLVRGGGVADNGKPADDIEHAHLRFAVGVERGKDGVPRGVGEGGDVAGKGGRDEFVETVLVDRELHVLVRVLLEQLLRRIDVVWGGARGCVDGVCEHGVGAIGVGTVVSRGS